MMLKENAQERILKCKAVCKAHVSVTDFTGGTFSITESLKITDLPPFLRVCAELYPEEGSYIRTELWLPHDFNGIFLGTGNGGMAGQINYSPLATRIKAGYAVANTDMGTSGGMKRGIANRAVWSDFGWRATHLMTELSKIYIKAAYDTDILYSYFLGGSTGGEQALAEAQRFPDDYDGIIAGAPANNRICLHTYFLWNFIHSKDSERNPLFPFDDCRAITDAAVKYYQKNGDVIPGDNFVTHPKSDEKTVGDFISFLKNECPNLTSNQLDSLTKIYIGPTNPRTGERIYNGLPMGSEMYGCSLYDTSRDVRCPHDYPFFWALGEDFDIYSFDFDRDLDRVIAALSQDMDANDANLMPFFSKGGKLIFASGTADATVPFADALNYFSRVCETCGDKADENMRFYIVPSRDHSVASMHPSVINYDKVNGDVFDTLRMWCEKGKAPDKLYAMTCGYGDKNAVAREISAVKYPVRIDETPCCEERYLKGKTLL